MSRSSGKRYGRKGIGGDDESTSAARRVSPRVPGYSEMLELMEKMHTIVRTNDGDVERPKVLNIPVEATSSKYRIDYLLAHLELGGTQILRIQTPIGRALNKDQMDRLMVLLEPSAVWGLNMGELSASDDAWIAFANQLPKTSVGFAWINEIGKDIGATAKTHRWLLGIGEYRDNGILRGLRGPLAVNRTKPPATQRPWFQGSNVTLKAAIARKFLFNPHSSKHFRPND